jgi:hypothetical protein
MGPGGEADHSVRSGSVTPVVQNIPSVQREGVPPGYGAEGVSECDGSCGRAVARLAGNVCPQVDIATECSAGKRKSNTLGIESKNR